MHPTTIIVLGLAMTGLSLAQTSTLSLYIPGADTQPLVASIIAADATATTYAVQCAPGTDSNNCGIGNSGITLTEGPARAAYTLPAEIDANGTLVFTGYFDCSLAGTTSAVCVESFGGTEANFPGMSTETLTGKDYTSMPVIITAGHAAATNTGSSLSASTTSGTGQATNTSTSGSGAKTSGTSSGGVAAQTSGTSSKASGSSTSTAAGAAITAPAWMLGGAALALAAMA